MKKHFFPLLLFCLMLSGTILFAGCGNKEASTSEDGPPVFSPPRVLLPEAPGTDISENPPVRLDYSNTGQGYVTVQNLSPDKKVNLQLTDPGGILYSYFVPPDTSTVLPFSGGSGNYTVICYEQVSGEQYAAIYSQTLDITLENEFLPFLYPNQYVWYTADSDAIAKSLSLTGEDAPELETLEAIYNYVIGNITYDTAKAADIDAGYLPDIDETLATGTGICFDYAALMTAMLRARDIPCKLQIGYAGDVKHAWIDVYIRGHGWVNKIIEFNGSSWTRMDPTFASNADSSGDIDAYIGDGTNYSVQFTR